MSTAIVVTSPLAADASRVAIDFGIVPHLSNLQQFSYSFWIRRNPGGSFGPIIGKSVDEGAGRRGHYVILNTQRIIFTSYKTPTDGTWETGNVIPNDGAWHHVAFMYNNQSDIADPVIYVDGVSVAVTETGAPSGQTDDDSDCPLMLFNFGPDPAELNTEYYYDVVHGFSLKDVRVYNRLLAVDEIAELEAGENNYSTVLNNKLFHAVFAITDNLNQYVGEALGADNAVLDIVYGIAGRPYNENETSSDTMITGEAI